MRKRLGFTGEEGKNLLDSTLLQRIQDADHQTAGNDATLAKLERAISHVELYGWEVDPAPPMPEFRFSTADAARSMQDELMRDIMAGRVGGFADEMRRRRPLSDFISIDPVKGDDVPSKRE